MQRGEWWESFFSGFWLDVQKHIWSEKQTSVEADCIERLLHLAPRAKIIDVPCGEGRLSVELASRGFRVTGVDATLSLLADGQCKAEKRQLDVVWEHRDMRDLPWEAEFDASFCFWGSFGYFDKEDNDLAFLKAVSRTLKPGGKFLLDVYVHCAEVLLPMYERRDWRRFGELLVLEERYYDHAQGRNEVEWTFIQENKIEVKRSSIRVYTYRDLCCMLRAAGFVDCEGYGSLAGEPFELGAKRLLLVARKT